ncbi:hypothetical protein LDC_2381 [sediment metagenome]|uniref:Uncharacterized protein n=1 Tax=sediment metagenome TaxID=749907 RepID=D9PLF8_9ZZZZ
MENIERLLEMLREMGLKREYKPYQERESGAVLLEVKHPAEIVDGVLVGSDIDVYDRGTFRVWTHQTKKGRAYAARYGLHIRLMDGECELFIPAHLADTLLREFGAKVKRPISEKAMAHLKAIGFKKHTQEARSRSLTPQKGISIATPFILKPQSAIYNETNKRRVNNGKTIIKH